MILQKFPLAQESTLNAMRDNVFEIKSQLCYIKEVTESKADFNTNLRVKTKTMDEKNISLKSNPNVGISVPHFSELYMR